MWKKITLVSVCFGLVIGCGDKDAAQVKAIDSSAGKEKQQIVEQKSETAIYLPGGVGVDFGIKPAREVLSEDNLSKIKAISYRVSGSMADVDRSLLGIVASAGYSRQVNKDPGHALSVTYKKIGGQRFDYFHVRYNEVAGEDFDKYALVNITWRLEFN